MSDADDEFDNDDEFDDDEFDDDEFDDDEFDDGTSELDRTRADYSGVDLDDEFQPVDEVELAEEGMLLDDPERMAELADGADDPDGSDASPRHRLDPDDVGWDLDDTD